MVRWLLAVLVLALFPAPASAGPLAGTNWRVVKVDGHKVPRSTGETLDFTAHNVSGNLRCTSFGGRYHATATRLRFRDISVAGVGCAARAVPSILGAVFGTRRYLISGRKLELLGRRGRTLAVLKRR